MSEYICKLPQTFKAQMKVDDKFQHVEIDTLYFKEPTARHCYIELKKIKGYIMKSILSIPESQKKANTGGKSDISAKEILEIINLDENACEKFYTLIQQLLCNGLCFIDIGMTQSLTRVHLDLMTNDSLDTTIESYLDFFSSYFLKMN